MPAIIIVLISLFLTACGQSDLENQLEDQKKTFQSKYDNLQTQLASTESKKKELDDKISLVENELKKSNQLLEEEKKNSTALKNSIQLLQIDKKSEDINALNSPSINALKKQLEESQSSNDTLKQEISGVIKELREKTSQFKSMQSQIADANTQQEMLKQQIQEYKSNNQLEQQNKAAESSANIEQLKQQLTESQSSNNELKQSLEQIKTELTNQSAQLDETFKKYSELELKLSNTLAQLKEALDKQKQLETELATSNQNLIQTQEKLVATQQNLSKAEKEIVRVNQNYEDVLAQNSILENQNNSSKFELTKLNQTLDNTQSKYNHLKNSRGLYTVQANDSLSSIASYFYRNGNLWVKIWEANQTLLKKPDLIYKGLVITIPQLN